MTPSGVRVLDEVLAIVRARRGLDFRGYRRSTIQRRLTTRMVSIGVSSGDAYLCALRENETETDRLIAHLTLKVSRFYRNAAVFDAVRDAIVPSLRRDFPGEPLRAWSAGCANGEEAYTLALLLGDASGAVWGTDVDAGALAAARAARYGAGALAELPGDLRRHFTAVDGARSAVVVSEAMRRRVRFAWHDLTTARSAPDGLRFHLVCCRNVVIYFEPAVQARALRLLAESLAPGGVLCLGEAEWADAALGLEVIDRTRRIFRRRAPGGAA